MHSIFVAVENKPILGTRFTQITIFGMSLQDGQVLAQKKTFIVIVALLSYLQWKSKLGFMRGCQFFFCC